MSESPPRGARLSPGLPKRFPQIATGAVENCEREVTFRPQVRPRCPGVASGLVWRGHGSVVQARHVPCRLIVPHRGPGSRRCETHPCRRMHLPPGRCRHRRPRRAARRRPVGCSGRWPTWCASPVSGSSPRRPLWPRSRRFRLNFSARRRSCPTRGGVTCRRRAWPAQRWRRRGERRRPARPSPSPRRRLVRGRPGRAPAWWR